LKSAWLVRLIAHKPVLGNLSVTAARRWPKLPSAQSHRTQKTQNADKSSQPLFSEPIALSHSRFDSLAFKALTASLHNISQNCPKPSLPTPSFFPHHYMVY